ncbi:MAG: lysophospholipid acyltransferase family protein [Bacteroidia bacterium]
MIPASHSKLGRWFWGGFSRWGIKLAFAEMRYPAQQVVDPNRSILLLGNHISWWDGFWPLELNRRHFNKKYHVMMLEEELNKRPFMAKGGAFSINPGSRDVVKSLRYAADLLHDPGNLVVIYPQGKIHSQHETDITFNAGVKKIAEWAPAETQVFFSAALLDYGAQARPTLTYYLEEYSPKDQSDLQAAYAQFNARALAAQRAAWHL